ncbi:hypothetical protein ACFL0H_07720 [Thermodesulfobacteriota bacterium]
MNISISASALKFMKKMGIQDVTFNLRSLEAAGCCVGIVKEIEPTYKAVENAVNYRYYKAGDKHIFVSRDIRILGPLTLTTEGFWKLKRLALAGATIPL